MTCRRMALVLAILWIPASLRAEVTARNFVANGEFSGELEAAGQYSLPAGWEVTGDSIAVRRRTGDDGQDDPRGNYTWIGDYIEIATAAEKTRSELIANGDFSGATVKRGDNRCPAGWQCTGNVVVTRPVEADGGRYVRIHANRSSHGYVYQTVPAESLSGKGALFQCDVRYEDCKPGPEPYMKARALVLYVGSDGGTHEFSRSFEGTSDWQSVRMPCGFPADMKAVKVMLGLHTSSGTLCVKNVKLAPDTTGYALATGCVGQRIAAEGLRGKTVLLQCKVRRWDCTKGAGPDMRARALVRCSRAGGKAVEFSECFEGSGDWDSVNMECRVPDDADDVTILFGFQEAGGKIQVRDVCLYALGAPEARTISEGVIETDYGEGIRKLDVKGAVWYDVSEREPAPSGELAATAAERARGFVVYQRPTTKVAPAETKPGRDEVLENGQPVALSLCPGETRSAAAIVYPLKDLRMLRFVFEDLKSENGAIIPATSLRADYLSSRYYRANWYAEYAEMPRFISRFDTIDLPARNGWQFWIFCTPPEDTPGGTYTGEVALLSNEKKIGKIALQVRVSPFKLDPTPVHWSMYYYYLPGENTEAHLQWMKSWGMTSVIYSPPSSSMFERLTYEDGKVGFDFAPDDRFMEEYTKAGFTEPVIYYPRLLLLRLVELLGEQEGFKRRWFHTTWIPLIPKAEDYPPKCVEAYRDVIKLIVSHAKENNWPETVLYLTDEPDPLYDYSEAETLVSYKIAKQAAPETKTFCTIYHPDTGGRAGQYVDYWSSSGLKTTPPHPFSEKMRNASAGKSLWATAWPGLFWHNYWFARAYAGLVCAKSGFEGNNVWYLQGAAAKSGSDPIHLRAGEKIVDWTLEKAGYNPDLGSMGHGLYAVNDRGEVQNSTIWEGVREGILDYRYIATLRNALKAAKAEGRDVADDRKALDDIIQGAPALPWESHKKKDTPGRAGAGDWSVAKNEEAIEQIAAMIVRIQAR